MNQQEKEEHDKRIALGRLIDQKLKGYADGLEHRVAHLEQQLGEVSERLYDVARRLAQVEERRDGSWG